MPDCSAPTSCALDSLFITVKYARPASACRACWRRARSSFSSNKATTSGPTRRSFATIRVKAASSSCWIRISAFLRRASQMPDDLDRYESYYADKLWALLPAVYRAEDTDAFDQNGPLRELVNRIGAQAAILRRSIDRLWEDQSIETCDDWVIPYIGDLLATNLVSSLDARGQRLDVAKTIYYRRRKGTVALLEELAHDITGWEVRVVEFFRRLARTRHGFDPEIGLPSATSAPLDNRTLQLAEGLVGQLTNTGIGGWADLRNVYGAQQAQSPFGIYDRLKPPSAFDEYFHTADFRRGRGRSGWYNISHLGVFVWRLYSFPLIDQEPDTLLTVPVQNADPACPNHYAFDPTGR